MAERDAPFQQGAPYYGAAPHTSGNDSDYEIRARGGPQDDEFPEYGGSVDVGAGVSPCRGCKRNLCWL